jgi:O-antigen ligase
LIQRPQKADYWRRFNAQPIPTIVTGESERAVKDPSFLVVMILIGLHFVVAFLMKQSQTFTTIHAYLTLAVSFIFVLRVRNHPEQLVYVLGYIAGAELLWRGNNASTFYEIGKYSLIVLSILGSILFQRPSAFSKWPLLYLVLLVPSFFVLPYFDRESIAFNLAGPVAMASISVFLGAVHLPLSEFKRVLLAVLIPSVSLGFLSLFYIVTNENIVFTGVSLKATSAGIGPNQVASALGLAMVCAYAYVVLETKNKPLRLLMAGIAIWMLVQTMLTFSRGGLWAAVGAVVVSTIYFLRYWRSRIWILMVSAILIPLFVYGVFPMINDFTGNTLSRRLKDPDTTNRDILMQVDLQLFRENPIFGAGPGQSKVYHTFYFRSEQPHTEYTRLLAEHGLFGVAALIILAVVTAQRVFSRRSTHSWSFGVMFTVWALLTMAHSATRLVVVSLIFALPEMTLDIDEEKENKVAAGRSFTHARSSGRTELSR